MSICFIFVHSEDFVEFAGNGHAEANFLKKLACVNSTCVERGVTLSRERTIRQSVVCSAGETYSRMPVVSIRSMVSVPVIRCSCPD